MRPEDEYYFLNDVERKRVHETIASVLIDEERVRFAYLYGAFVKYPDHGFEDVDVAAFLSEEIVRDLSYQTNLQQRLEEAVTLPWGSWIDLRVMNGAALTFVGPLIESGLLLCEQDREERVLYEMRILSQWWDFRPLWADVENTGDVVILFDSDNDQTDRKFRVRHDSDAEANELFTIDEAGKVGIGTTSPEALLNLKSALPEVKLECSDASMVENQHIGDLAWKSSDPSGPGVGTKGSIAVISRQDIGNIYRMGFFTSDFTASNDQKERVSILDDGKVGIGNTSPAEKLEVNGNIKVSNGIATDGSTDFLKWKIFTGTLKDAVSDDITVTGVTSIVGVLFSALDSEVADRWRVYDHMDDYTDPMAFRLSFDNSTSKVHLNNIGARFQGQSYKLIVFYT